MLDILPIDPAYFARGALLFYVIGLLLRDGLRLRLFLLAGTTCYLAYYYTVDDAPLWDAIVSSSAIFLANSYAIARLLAERTTFTMTPAQKALYTHFPTMTPGQFRRILRAARWKRADAPARICTERAVPPALYFITRGPVTLERGGQETTLEPGKFIAEMSFIRGPEALASASVTLGAGAEYVEWDRARLYRILDRSLPLANALAALFNHDLATKLTRSWPSLPSDEVALAPTGTQA